MTWEYVLTAQRGAYVARCIASFRSQGFEVLTKYSQPNREWSLFIRKPSHTDQSFDEASAYYGF